LFEISILQEEALGEVFLAVLGLLGDQPLIMKPFNKVFYIFHQIL
jgi:hypothetical protein